MTVKLGILQCFESTMDTIHLLVSHAYYFNALKISTWMIGALPLNKMGGGVGKNMYAWGGGGGVRKTEIGPLNFLCRIALINIMLILQFDLRIRGVYPEQYSETGGREQGICF